MKGRREPRQAKGQAENERAAKRARELARTAPRSTYVCPACRNEPGRVNGGTCGACGLARDGGQDMAGRELGIKDEAGQW